MHYRCLSHTFSVAAERSEDLAALSAALSPFAQPGPAAGTRYELRSTEPGLHALLVDGREVRFSADPHEPLDLLLWYVGEQTVKAEEHHLLLHAGAVTAPSGRAMLLPGASGSGKSTTTYGLVRAGFGYLSDELAVLDPDTGSVRPFPRPIALKTGTRRALPEVDGLASHVPGDARHTVHLPADRLRAPTGTGAVAPGWIVFPHYSAGSDTALEPMPPGTLCVELLRSTFNVGRRPGTALAAMARIAETCPGYRLRVGDLDEAVGLLAGLSGSRETPTAASVPS